MTKKIILVLCLYILSLSAKGMTDSQLMAEVARTGQLLQQMQFDSALVQVDRLLPIAKENRHQLAQATLHGIAGFCLAHNGKQEAGLQEYMRSTAIAERHQLLQAAISDTTGTILTLFAVMYSEMSFRYQELGNNVEALNDARIALRWLSHVDNPSLRVVVMASIMPSLSANKEWRPAYNLMRQAFTDACHLQQYDFAVVMAGYLMSCEDDIFGRGPEESDWMGQADKLLPLTTTHKAREEYTTVRQALVSKYAPKTAMPSPVTQQGDISINEVPDSAEGKELPDTLHAPATIQPEEKGLHAPSASNLLLWGLSAMALLLIAFYLWYRHTTKKKQERTARQMAEKYAEGQEYERNRLARELHDGVSNQLLAVEMKLSTDGLTSATMQLLDESREQVRRVSHELVQPEFSHATLAQVLNNYVAELNGVRHCNISFQASPSQTDWSFIPATTALEIYRIVQELIANALKHSGATIISVGLHHDDGRGVMILISDNGDDNEPSPTASAGIGLRNIRHRAEALGGTLEFLRHQYGRVAKLVITLPEEP